MSKVSVKKGVGIALAAAGLLAAGCGPHTPNVDNAPHFMKCSGVNTCKGHGGCASDKNSCAGKNSCKGKGWVSMHGKKNCEDVGGRVHTD